MTTRSEWRGLGVERDVQPIFRTRFRCRRPLVPIVDDTKAEDDERIRFVIEYYLCLGLDFPLPFILFVEIRRHGGGEFGQGSC